MIFDPPAQEIFSQRPKKLLISDGGSMELFRNQKEEL
jgi:hypothetical protein